MARRMAAGPSKLSDDVLIRDNPDRRRYELYVGSELAGVAEYHAQAGS